VAPPGNEAPAAEPVAIEPPAVAHVEDLAPISVPIAPDPQPAVQAAAPPADLAPIDVPMAVDVPRLDVAKQLAQPILEFTQDQPVAARNLLRQIAEMSAVPIDVTAVEIAEYQERLERPVSVGLKETTVGAILDEVAMQAGLRVEIAREVIVVRPAESR
jgi:hypothetical protein